ncbi:hypothetical protein BGZ73_004488 [Actinomortierella ambigua]|nr:hypothetical protein BGZ73_004488 [Actinomortierella ambigua]
MQTEKPHSSQTKYMPAGVDEFLQKEGLTQEEWERIFDLRYCTILVPKKEDSDSSNNDPNQHNGFLLREEHSTDSVVQQLQVEPHQSQDTLAPAGTGQRSASAAPPPSILTKHRSNSMALPPTPAVPNSKRRRLIDPSLEIDEQPAFISEDSSDDDVVGHEQGQSELGGVSEDEGPMSSNDPMFGFLRLPRRSRRESTSSGTNNTLATNSTATTTKKPSSRSFFSRFWRSDSPDIDHGDLAEPDNVTIKEDPEKATTRSTPPKVDTSTIEVVNDRTIKSNRSTPTAMEIDQQGNDTSDESMKAEPALPVNSAPKTQTTVQTKDRLFGDSEHRTVKEAQKSMANNIGERDKSTNRSITTTATASATTTTSTATHWPIPSPTHQLLRERRPRANTDFSHLAWMTSPSLGAKSSSSSHSLLKPRHFSPPPQAPKHPAFGQREPFSIPEQPKLLRKTTTPAAGREREVEAGSTSNDDRRSSLSTDISSSSHASTMSSLFLPRVPLAPSMGSQRATPSSDDWTNYHWSHLEVLYIQMNGDQLSEDNLWVVVDKFLEEDERQSGKPDRWSRNMIRRRCVALHRIRHTDKRRGTVSPRPWEQQQPQPQQQQQDGTEAPVSDYTPGEDGDDVEGDTKKIPFNLTSKRLPLTPFTPLAGPKTLPTPNPEALRDLLHPKGSTSSSTFVHRRRARESARPYPSTSSFQPIASSLVSNVGPSANGGVLPSSSSSDTSSPSKLPPGQAVPSSAPSSFSTTPPASHAPPSQGSLQRQERRKKMKLSQDIHTQKAVFKNRLAVGLKSVRQLLPFWREVENGQGTIKELIEVPLVPQRKVKNVVDAFETVLDEAEAAAENDNGSVAGGTDLLQGGRRQRRMSSVSMASVSRRSSVSGASESVAEMIARGHAERMRSSVSSYGSSSASSSATLVTPPRSARPTEV